MKLLDLRRGQKVDAAVEELARRFFSCLASNQPEQASAVTTSTFRSVGLPIDSHAKWRHLKSSLRVSETDSVLSLRRFDVSDLAWVSNQADLFDGELTHGDAFVIANIQTSAGALSTGLVIATRVAPRSMRRASCATQRVP